MRNKLTDAEYELCELQQLNKITYDEFISNFPEKFTLQEILAIVSNLRSDVKGGYKLDLLSNLISSSLSKEEIRQLYLVLLKEDWHDMHERYIGGLQNYYCGDIKVIEPLLALMHNPFKQFLHIDFYGPFVRKIIYAIGAQPEPANIEALEELTKSENVIIRDFAIHQLDKRKLLGRWEAERNKQWE
jgi:hypothetical protein